MKKLRKFLVVSVMVLSTMFMGGFAFLAAPTPTLAASASAGDLIKMNGLTSVYYLGANGKRYVFPNSTTYFSWYPDFSGVVTIPASELQSYPLGGNVTMQAGTKLVKITTDPAVYAVSPNGVLHKIGNEAQAAALYGTNWAKRVVDVPDAFFTNYTVGAPLASGAIPAGSLVKNAGSANVYYYDGSNYSLVPNEAVASSNHFDLSNAITVSTAITASATVSNGEFANVAQNGGSNNVATGSGLMVSLNANTAPSNTIISTTNSGQAIAPLASFNLTAANDGAVTIKSIRLHRIGVSSDNSLSNVYLYNGNEKLTDAGSFSNSYVTFSNSNGIITVPAGQTLTITVKADVASTVSGGNIGVAINAASDIVTSASSVSGSFPLNGNLMSMTTVNDLATVQAVNAIPTGSGTTIDAGTIGAILWSDSFNVGNKAVKLSYLSFRQIGSVPADAIQNLKLYVNGVQAGSTASIGSNNRVTFDLSANPVLLNTGSSLVELRGDIVKGSNYNYSFSVQTSADMVLTGTNYNVNVALSGSNLTPLSASSTTINNGSVSVQRDPSFTATQFVANQAQTTLGQWTMKAYGESEKIQSLKVNLSLTGAVASTEGFNNVTLYVDGSSVGSSQNALGTTTDLTFGSTNLFTIPVGKTVTVTLKGDSVLNGGTGVTGVTASLISPVNAFEGLSSFTYTPSSEATSTATALTTGNSGATISANAAYANQSIVTNSLVQKIGSYMIQASSVDGVKVTSLNVGVNPGSSSSLTDTTNLYIVTPDMPNGSVRVNPASSNNFTTNFTIPANGTVQVDVYADTTSATSSFSTSLSGTGLGAISNQSVTLASTTGQTITVGNGALNSFALTNSSPVSQIVVGGTNGQAMATYNFVGSTSGGVTISELGFKFASSTATSTAVASVTVDGHSATVVNGQALVTGLSLSVPATYGGLDVPVTVNYSPVGINGVADQPVVMTLNHVKYLASGITTQEGELSGDTAFSATQLGLATSSNEMQLAGVAPVVSLVAASGTLTSGTVKIGSVKVVAPTGNMILTDLPINLSASTATIATGTAFVVKDASNGTTITTTGTTTPTGVGTSTITFSPAYTVTAGSVGKTFDIYAPVTVSGAAGTNNVSLGLGDSSLFTWKDVNGNADLTGVKILNYPNTTISLGN